MNLYSRLASQAIKFFGLAGILVLSSCAQNSDISNPPLVTLPKLVAPADQTYTAGEAITALSFQNDGGSPQASGCTVAPALPMGLMVAVASSSCQITGTPAAVSGETAYTVTAANASGSSKATVNITVVSGSVTIEDVQIASTGNMSTPQAGDDLTLTFTTVGTTSFDPQVSIGGQFADVTAGATAGEWTATVTVDANFVPGTAGFEVIVVVPNGVSPTEDLSQGIAVTTVGTTPADLTLEDTTGTFLLTPILVLEDTTYSFTIDQPITAITFINEGGAVTVGTGCAPASGTTLPMGLSLAVSGSTCQITGAPTVLMSDASYTVVATNSSGVNQINLNIAVVAAAAADPYVILDSNGITNGNFYSAAYAPTGDFSMGTVVTGEVGAATHDKVRWSTTGGVTEVTYQSGDSAPGVAYFQVTQNSNPNTPAPVDLSAYAQGNVVFDIKVPSYGNYSNLVVKSDASIIEVFDATVDLDPGVGSPDWETVSVSVADYVADGLDLTQVTTVFVIYPDEDTQKTKEGLVFMLRNIRWEATAPTTSDAPMLSNIAGTQTFAAMVEIDPIIFTNDGGDVQADAQGCQFTSSSGSSTTLPAGLTLAPTTEGSPRTCQITGAPTGEVPSMQYTITARNTVGTDTATVTIVVGPAPDAPDLADIAGTQTFAAMVEIDPIIFTNDGGDVQAGAQGCEFTSSSGSSTMLPAGLTLAPTADNQTCQITGAPMAETPSMQYTITGRNVTGTDIATVTIVVGPAPDAPNLADIAGTQTFAAMAEIDPYYLHQRWWRCSSRRTRL